MNVICMNEYVTVSGIHGNFKEVEWSSCDAFDVKCFIKCFGGKLILQYGLYTCCIQYKLFLYSALLGSSQLRFGSIHPKKTKYYGKVCIINYFLRLTLTFNSKTFKIGVHNLTILHSYLIINHKPQLHVSFHRPGNYQNNTESQQYLMNILNGI